MFEITGTYDFTYAAFTLPEAIVTALLPTSWHFLSEGELSAAGLDVPNPGPGRRHCCIQIGLQKESGMSLPFGIGRNTFYEGKLEIPFLRHPKASTSTAVTLKQTLLFSSSLMAGSSSSIVGLRSSKVEFEDVNEGRTISAKHSMSVTDGDRQSRDEPWSEELIRACLNGWWAGERSGNTVSRFEMTPKQPPRARPRLNIRLHLPSFLKLSIEETRHLTTNTDVEIDEDGWLEVAASGWRFLEGTLLKNGKASSL